MKYIPPLNWLPGDELDEDRSHWNAVPESAVTAEREGSYPSAIGFEATQREIVNAIIAAGLTPDEEDYTQLAAAIPLLIPTTPVLTGAMLWWPKSTPPSWALVRDGAAYSRATYADLFAAIGTDYGVGDGVTTFNVPDDRGLFMRGWDDGAGIDTGRVFGSYQAEEINAHTHSMTLNSMVGDDPGGSGAQGWGGDNMSKGSRTNTTASTGGAETRPKNRAYLPIIIF